MVKSWNRISFVETQNAKKPSLSIGMRRSTTSIESNSVTHFIFKQLCRFRTVSDSTALNNKTILNYQLFLRGELQMEDFSNEAYYRFFAALANRTRLAIIDVLKEEAKTLSEISSALKHEQEAIKENLELLEHCALIRSEDKGKEKRYALNKEVLEPLSEILSFHTSKYCPGLKECIPEDKLRQYMKQEAAKKMYIEHE